MCIQRGISYPSNFKIPAFTSLSQQVEKALVIGEYKELTPKRRMDDLMGEKAVHSRS
jgi:hypothetical protein